MPAITEQFLPLIGVVLGSIIILGAAHYLLLARRQDLGSEAKLPRQLTLLVMTIISVILVIMVSPVSEPTRNQVLSLFGILMSGVLAISSTSFVTNFMAALMLRITRPFNVGDFITVENHFGKVSERGLFDTEIQTENRELIAIPNATFIQKPVSVMRKSGVVVTTEVSLGYDESHTTLEPLMIETAIAADLSDPFVLVTDLGDFAVTYRVCGLLKDVDNILTARSRLNRSLLDCLHDSGVEVVSPNVTRHITHDPTHRILPEAITPVTKIEETSAEAIVFDKAREITEAAEKLKDLQVRTTSKELPDIIRRQLDEEIAALEARLRELKEAD